MRSLFGFLLVSAVFLLAGGCQRPAPRPDILVVTIDTLRADHCSTYGYPVPTTPVLTELAGKGMLFRTAYAEAATTAPSHAVLFTGRHFRNLGVYKNGEPLADEFETLAETLSAQGYATAAFVSSFPLRSRFGFAQGFEIFDDEFTPAEASIGRQGGENAHDRRADVTAARAIGWLQARKDSRPLFVWVHFVDPHYPYRSPERFQAKWPANTKSEIRRYDGEIRFADKHLGKVVDAFGASSARGAPLVVVTSDHGEGLGQHGWMSHGINLYEEAVRVPLVASWPGHFEQGRVADEPVGIVDVVPTILEALALPLPPDLDGRSLLGPLDPDRPIFLQRRSYASREVRGVFVAGPMTAIVKGGTKYLETPLEEREELYDLVEDPAELRNLLSGASDAGETEARSLPPPAHALAGELAEWRTRHAGRAENAEVDEESRRALRALGYVD